MYRVKWKFSQRAHECRSWVLRWVSYYRPSLYIDFSLYIHLQSNPVFRYGQHCNIVTQYCNIDRLIALANCNRHEQIESWNSQTICKQSLWLDYKKEGSTNPVAQTIWLASLFLIIQSEALFTNLLCLYLHTSYFLFNNTISRLIQFDWVVSVWLSGCNNHAPILWESGL